MYNIVYVCGAIIWNKEKVGIFGFIKIVLRDACTAALISVMTTAAAAAAAATTYYNILYSLCVRLFAAAAAATLIPVPWIISGLCGSGGGGFLGIPFQTVTRPARNVLPMCTARVSPLRPLRPITYTIYQK